MIYILRFFVWLLLIQYVFPLQIDFVPAIFGSNLFRIGYFKNNIGRITIQNPNHQHVYTIRYTEALNYNPANALLTLSQTQIKMIGSKSSFGVEYLPPSLSNTGLYKI